MVAQGADAAKGTVDWHTSHQAAVTPPPRTGGVLPRLPPLFRRRSLVRAALRLKICTVAKEIDVV
ncbi:hypothetical protein HUT19_33525 [Streptomyces sp. NA02950]|uniref:hypothetical protein n=1 Tax=Streptomyces sp. NA02950 TaxID=2742137 RepID=UPI0015929017|nr:hypothetical protein [Streptomyces sp. NA02950]QKV96044.1 hypothetical protein HUT19_33525 [Streptomyces sp. NA02950]